MNKSGTVHSRDIPHKTSLEAEMAALETIKGMIPDSTNDGRKQRKNPCKGHRWYRSKQLIKVPNEDRWVESFTVRDSSLMGIPKLIHHAYYYCKLCTAHELVPRIVGEVNNG